LDELLSLPQRLLRAAASLKLTLLGLLLLGITTVLVYTRQESATPWLAGPLLLLALNLVAAVASNKVFRRQLPLLVFHLALIVLVLLAAIGRLTYLKGQAELTEGAAFQGLTVREAGPLHSGALEQLHFIHEGFDIRYLPGPVLDSNQARLRWEDTQGRMQSGTIEPNQPLVLRGYRIYPTSNKGFAPVFVWQAHQREPLLLSVHLPSYPANALSQAQTWQPPGASEALWVLLPVAADLIPADRPSRFALPKEQRLVLRRGDKRYEMQPGERLELGDGTLAYRGLSTWMGYRVFYDWTIPWMLAACAVALTSMGLHFWRKFGDQPWQASSA